MGIETDEKNTMTVRCPECIAVNIIVKDDFHSRREIQFICVNCKHVTLENPDLSPTQESLAESPSPQV
jgi:DNA-directed RNA polymerase subunit RPC12/RpoP